MSCPIRERLANPGNYGGTRRADQIQYLVIHYTGNKGDSAGSNAAYFATGKRGASAHYFVDEREVWQSVPDLRTAWHCGTSGAYRHPECRNANSIGIEICLWDKAGAIRRDSIDLAVELARKLMDQYGIDTAHVLRHFDVTGKNCPAPFVERPELWAAFKQRLEEKPMDNTPSAYAKEAVEWAVKNGILTGSADGDLMLSQPVTRQQMVVMLWRYDKTKTGK